MSNPTVLNQALAQCIGKRLTFAAFRSPGQHVQLWAQRDPRLETVDATALLGLNQVFLAAPFTLDRERIPFIRADIELMFPEIDPDISRLQECRGSAPVENAVDGDTGLEQFTAAVEEARKACASGALRKVVLSRVINADIPVDLWPGLFEWAEQQHPQAFVAMAFTPEHGLWMGASPECLVQENLDHVRVDALAATRPGGAVPRKISEWGAKELDEQEQVMCHVHATFARMDLANITARGPQVLQAGPVAHLHTVLEADLADTMLGELVLAVHPTPAVCGMPVQDAQRFIAAHERHRRGLYAGFWGTWNADGPTELHVNLRCMRHLGGQTQLLTGAGITAASDPAMEWVETERKAQTWLQAPALNAVAG